MKPLAISLETRLSKRIPLFLFVGDREKPSRTTLATHLERREQEYVRSVEGSLPIRERAVRALVMPETGRMVVVIGLGDRKTVTPWRAILAVRLAVQTARKERIAEFALAADPLVGGQDREAWLELAAQNAVMANFDFVKYKTPPAEGFSFVSAIRLVVSRSVKASEREAVKRGMIIGEETNACRELANTPGGDMTPELLASHAKRVAAKNGITATILSEQKIKALGMGGVMGVAQGSDAPPRFIVLEYRGGSRSEKPVVLAGKGVTFDTGGLNLKPGDHIYEMHMDMSGGAAVIHAIAAAARLKLKRNVVAIVPAVENMPSGSSYRPGDLLKTMSGKTIEVLNTDAEGRVILADALEYAKRFDPALVVDVATLTGAAITALGMRYTALFATDKKLEDRFRALGAATGDPVWPLPLTADYEDDIRGTFGDWANTSVKGGVGGGAITAAVFLWQFTKAKDGAQAYPWVHLDIAPRMTTIDGEYLAKGAAGAPVRLLARLLEEGI